MECEWGNLDCINFDTKCYLCTSENLWYKPPKVRKNGLRSKIIKTTETKRQGSISEVKSFYQTKEALNMDVTGTPNSGAGRIKADEQIRGLLNVMIELKTTTRKNLNKQPGKETFTIQRAWLEKLEKEAKEANMDFQYLKFSFKENDEKFYAITENDVIIDMIVTMKHDRIKLKNTELEFDIYKKRLALAEAENIKLSAEIDLLKSKLKNKVEDL